MTNERQQGVKMRILHSDYHSLPPLFLWFAIVFFTRNPVVVPILIFGLNSSDFLPLYRILFYISGDS